MWSQVGVQEARQRVQVMGGGDAIHVLAPAMHCCLLQRYETRVNRQAFASCQCQQADSTAVKAPGVSWGRCARSRPASPGPGKGNALAVHYQAVRDASWL